MSPYVASKFAIRGWSASLRMELRGEPEVSVCTVLPSSVDTSLFQHAGNRTGQRIESPSFPMDPYRVADTIVGVLRRPHPETVVGQMPRLITLARSLAPSTTERVLGPAMAHDHTAGGSVSPSSGALFRSLADGEVTGGWRALPVPSPARLLRGAGAAIGGAALGGVVALGERLRSS